MGLQQAVSAAENADCLGDQDPEDFMRKMMKRRDKFSIREKIHISEGEQIIYKKMRQYDAVVIWDLPRRCATICLSFVFPILYAAIRHRKFRILLSAAPNRCICLIHRCFFQEIQVLQWSRDFLSG